MERAHHPEIGLRFDDSASGAPTKGTRRPNKRFLTPFPTFSDTVYATAISVSVKVYAANQSDAALEAAVTDITSPSPLAAIRSDNGTGNLAYISAPAEASGIFEGILIQYTILPPRGPNDGTWQGDGVMFDATQATQLVAYGRQSVNNPWATAGPSTPWPTDDGGQVETPNDDGSGREAQSAAVNSAGHYYYYDAPGIEGDSQDKNLEEQVRQNFHNWLRVSYDGIAPSGNDVAGTLVPGSLNNWCMALTVQQGSAANNWAWTRTTGDSPQAPGFNSVGPGQLDVNDPTNKNGVSN